MKAQPGKDGSYTVNSANQVLNKYCPVASNISAGSSSLVLAHAALAGLCPGDLILIYQAQGATINTSNSSSYGDITNYNNAGLYEFHYVQSLSGNTVYVQGTFGNSYNSSGKLQVVKVPQYTSLIVNSGASIVAKNWKDTIIQSMPYRMGGIIAIHAQQIVHNGTISASGAGFRGGALTNDNLINTGALSYCSTLSTQGGEKGEGIFGYRSDYDGNGGRYGMGAAANAGGGGNNHNAGGGGGANGFNGNNWIGQGVMIVNSTNPLVAWSLSAAYVQNGNSLCNSSGGGRGGYSWADFNANALVQGPGNPTWIGDHRREVGGFGGRPLTNINPETRIYFGGGGGAPHQNNGTTQPGANGGGIVFLFAGGSISGNGLILADGNTGGNSSGCSCDAAPGGGAGGSIVIKSPSVSPLLTLRANGGNGGNQMALTPPGNSIHESEGPGGGGGGGFIACSAGGPGLVNGGFNGTTLSGAVTEMDSNGATAGASGQTAIVSTTFIPFFPVPTFTINATTHPPLVCSGNPSTLTATGAVSYTWQPGNLIGNPVVVQALQNTVYTLTGADANACRSSATLAIEVRPAPLLTVTATQTLICTGHSVTLLASGAFTYTWQPGNISGNPVSVTPPNSLLYIVNGMDASGCMGNGSLMITVVPCLNKEEFSGTASAPAFFPNPSKGTIHIVNDSGLNYKLSVYTLLGQLLQSCSGSELDESGSELNLSELEAGTYLLEFRYLDQIQIKKLILSPH